MVGPLPLPLETGGEGIMTKGFLAKPRLGEPRVPHHEIPGDESHLYTGLPIMVLLCTAPPLPRSVGIPPLFTVGARPLQCGPEFIRVIDLFLDAADKFRHVDRFHPHS